MSSASSYRRCAETAILTTAVGVLLLFVTRLGVDSRHDGMVLQPALVVADGGVIHRDVFEQYGAVTAWYHGAAVRLFGRTLLVVRTSSALLLASAIGLLFDASYFKYFESNLNSLAAYVKAHPRTPIINRCADGLLQSVTSSSEMPDPYYVLWAFRSKDVSFEHRAKWAIEPRPMAWFCPPSPDETAQAGLFGLRVDPLDPSTKALARQREWPYMSALAVPREWSVPEGATG